ncbi:MAG: FliO/MopB family protein [Myxococcaceae bacterium]
MSWTVRSVRFALCCVALLGTAAFAADEKPVTEGEHLISLPAHPLDDSNRSAAEKAALKPSSDSDAELDKALGLSKAAPAQTTEQPADNDTSGLGWQLFKTMLMLGVVIAMVYLSLNFGLRKLMGARAASSFGKGSVVTVVERITLEPRRTIYVLRAAGEYLLVGVGDGGMTLISKLDTAEVDRIQREKSSAQMPLSPFLQKLLSRKGGPPPSA